LLSKADFLKDELLLRGFVRSIEIMGEAAKQIPEDFRAKHAQVPWRVVAGMQDRLIHGYFTVDSLFASAAPLSLIVSKFR